MGAYDDGDKFVIIAVPNTIHFDLPKRIDTNMKHEIDYIIKDNEYLAVHKITKPKLVNYYPNISVEMIFINTKNSQTNEQHKLVQSNRLDLRSSNKHVARRNIAIYYTWKNIRQQ